MTIKYLFLIIVAIAVLQLLLQLLHIMLSHFAKSKENNVEISRISIIVISTKNIL